jgi:hypothetical protein
MHFINNQKIKYHRFKDQFLVFHASEITFQLAAESKTSIFHEKTESL